MRIGFNTSTIYEKNGSLKKTDGIGNYTLGLIENLQNTNNLEVVQCFFDFTPLDMLNRKKANEKLFYQPSVFAQDIWPANLFNKLEEKIDVFHSTDYHIPRLRNTPVVATLHDAIMLKQEKYANQRFRAFKNYLLKKHVQYADHIITISNAMVPEIINYWNIDPKKISVVYNALDNIWFAETNEVNKNKVLEKYKINKKFLLFVGTLQPRKNLNRVLEAYQQLPKDIQHEYQLLIVGKRGWNDEKILSNILSLQKNNLIRWLEFIPKNDLIAIYQTATALVFPSLSEGFGLPIIEGFASKIPVITSNVLPMSEIADKAAYLVDPFSINELTTAIEKVVTDNNLRNNLIHKGTEQAQKFTYPQTIEKLIEIYNKLLNN